MIVIVILILLFFILYSGGSIEDSIKDKGYFVDLDRYALHKVDGFNYFNKYVNVLVKNYNRNLFKNYKYIGKYDSWNFLTLQPYPRQFNGLFIFEKLNKPILNLKLNEEKSDVSAKIMARYLRNEFNINEHSYVYTDNYINSSNISLCHYYIPGTNIKHWFNILLLEKIYYIMSSRYGFYKYRINHETADINHFLNNIDVSIFNFRNTDSKPIITIYPFVPNDPEIYELYNLNVEDYKKRMKIEYLSLINGGTLDARKDPDAVVDDIEKNNSYTPDEIFQMRKALNNLRIRTRICVNKDNMKMVYEKPDDFEYEIVHVGDMYNYLNKLFAKPAEYDSIVFPTTNMFNITPMGTLEISPKNPKVLRALVRADKFIDFYKERFPQFAELIEYMYTRADPLKKMVNPHLTINKYKNKGMKLHFDSSVEKLKIISVGGTAHYDLVPILTSGTPLRITIKNGMMSELKGDFLHKWAHSVPFFECEINHRYAIIFRDIPNNEDIKIYDPQFKGFLEMYNENGNFAGYRPSINKNANPVLLYKLNFNAPYTKMEYTKPIGETPIERFNYIMEYKVWFTRCISDVLFLEEFPRNIEYVGAIPISEPQEKYLINDNNGINFKKNIESLTKECTYFKTLNNMVIIDLYSINEPLVYRINLMPDKILKISGDIHKSFLWGIPKYICKSTELLLYW